MRVFKGFDNISEIRRPVVTIGSFDGVHAGHREILSIVTREARERGGESVVVTFEPHPRLLLEGGLRAAASGSGEQQATAGGGSGLRQAGGGLPAEGGGLRLLNSLDEKLALLERAGVDNVIIARFDRAFSRLSAEEFVKGLLVDKLHVDTLMAGYNHRLGHNKEGDRGGTGGVDVESSESSESSADALPVLAEKYGFRLVRMEPYYVDGGKVSSTVVRGLIGKGDMASAAHYLGYPYSIGGIAGTDGRFVPDEPRKMVPPAGSYRVEVCAEGAGGREREPGTAESRAQQRVGREREPGTEGYACEAEIDGAGGIVLRGCESAAAGERVRVWFVTL